MVYEKASAEIVSFKDVGFIAASISNCDNYSAGGVYCQGAFSCGNFNTTGQGESGKFTCGVFASEGYSGLKPHGDGWQCKNISKNP